MHLAIPGLRARSQPGNEALTSLSALQEPTASDTLGSVPFPLTSHLEQKASLLSLWVLDPFWLLFEIPTA